VFKVVIHGWGPIRESSPGSNFPPPRRTWSNQTIAAHRINSTVEFLLEGRRMGGEGGGDAIYCIAQRDREFISV
jgi:hypothetical protein